MAQAAGKREAFEREAMPHTPSLLRAARNITRNSSVAEDLVQDTLLRAWRFFDRFEPGTNCRARLFRIMLNLSHEVHTRAAPLLETDGADQTLAGADLLEQAAVRRAFGALPEDQRTVLQLAIVEGFTSKEIAEMLGLPMGTVMSRLSRGRAALRGQLTGEAGR